MQTQPATPVSPFRRLLPAVGAIVALVVGVSQLDSLFQGGLNAPVDFTAFWAGGRLAVNGENPYSGERLHEVQSEVGMKDLTVIAWHPPWTYSVFMPLGAVPFRTAYGLWILFHFGLLIASALLLWRTFGGAASRAWVPILLALTFTPTAFLIGGGQLTTVVLFGLAGFIAAWRADRPILAGIAFSITVTKPHLLLPFDAWILALACVSSFGRRVLLGAVIGGLLLCALPTIIMPSIWIDYFHALTGPPDPQFRPLSAWTPPLMGWWMRQPVPDKPFWIQWVPSLLAMIATAVWCVVKKPRQEDPSMLRVQVPGLVAVSLLFAPYGAWSYDLILLLIPIYSVTVWLLKNPDRRAMLVGIAWLAVVNAVALVMMLNHVPEQYYVWFAPCVLLGIAVVMRLAVRPTQVLTPANTGCLAVAQASHPNQ